MAIPRLMACIVFLTYVLVSVAGRPLSHLDELGFGFLPLLFRDLRNDGILGRGGKILIVAGVDEKDAINRMMNSENVGAEMELVSSLDLEKQKSLPEQAFDVAFVDGGSVQGFIDRSLKSGGVAAVRVSDESVNSYPKPDGYKMVYFRKFSSSSVIIGLKKGTEEEALSLEDQDQDQSSPTHRRLNGFATNQARIAALKKLEDVLLEPPRAASGKSRSYQKRTKYLPDLLGDSLENYPRRVFIDVGLPEKDGGSGSRWFDQNYPSRNLEFDKYKIETVAEESSGKEVVQVGLSEWLRKNVKEEEYVVMKAEAEAVEEMVKSKAIRLIDELFMECRARGLSNSNQNRRAYWECLALYGKLRDEGVAVHQWWG